MASEPRKERKVVTALFADLAGFTAKAEKLDPEDGRAMLSPYYARLRSQLEGFGGTVEEFIGDAVVALFGAPVAHEDDPERAVRAAMARRRDGCPGPSSGCRKPRLRGRRSLRQRDGVRRGVVTEGR